MTLDEAIEHLNTIGQYYSQDHSDPYEECERLTKDELDAIYLAINALEREQKFLDAGYKNGKVEYMTDIELVIRISEDSYKATCNGWMLPLDVENVVNAIKNGTPLPKGHGNLIQREDAEVIFKNARKALLEQSRKERIKDLQTREMMLLNAEQLIHLIPPIIEADKESEDKE